MPITIERNELARVAAAAARVAEKRSTIPILSNVLLSGADGVLTATGTDLDIEVQSKAHAEGDLDPVTVQAHALNDIARKLPKEAVVTIDVKDDHVQVKSGRSRFKLLSLPADDFPSIQQVEYTSTFSLTSDAVQALFGKTRHAISSEETRYYLKGAYLHIDDGRLASVTTDGHRMAIAYADVPEGAAGLEGVIIPTRTVGEIISLATGGDVWIEVSQRGIRASTPDTVITSKLVDATYPEYRRVLPKPSQNVATVDRDALNAAVTRVLTAAVTSHAVKFAFAPGGVSLEVRNDGREAEDEIEAIYTGAPTSAGYNGKYLLEHLAAIKGAGPVEFDVNEPGFAATIRLPEDPSWVGIVMPMRV